MHFHDIAQIIFKDCFVKKKSIKIENHLFKWYHRFETRKRDFILFIFFTFIFDIFGMEP